MQNKIQPQQQDVKMRKVKHNRKQKQPPKSPKKPQYVQTTFADELIDFWEETQNKEASTPPKH